MRNLAFLWFAGVFFAVLLFSCQKEDKTATAFYTDNVDFMASKTKQNRVCLLEDFCGVRCDFCPDGHARAKAIAEANPGKFIIWLHMQVILRNRLPAGPTSPLLLAMH